MSSQGSKLENVTTKPVHSRNMKWFNSITHDIHREGSYMITSIDAEKLLGKI